MARRSHLTEIGCIACDELAELGAGEREGGMTQRSLRPGDPSPTLPRPRVRSPSLRPLLPPRYAPPSLCRITALDCFPFGDLLAVAVGTSTGLILVYSLCRELIRKPQANAASYKITFLRSSVWSCLGSLPFLMARISFLVLKE
ncbi:unnamed protein product [Musa hybrid cultivar]